MVIRYRFRSYTAWSILKDFEDWGTFEAIPDHMVIAAISRESGILIDEIGRDPDDVEPIYKCGCTVVVRRNFVHGVSDRPPRRYARWAKNGGRGGRGRVWRGGVRR